MERSKVITHHLIRRYLGLTLS